MEVERLVQLLAMMQTDLACTPSDRSHELASSPIFFRRMTPTQNGIVIIAANREKIGREPLPGDSNV